MSIKRVRQNALIALIGIILTLALIEIGLRIWYPPPNLVKDYLVPDPVLGWRLESDATVIRRRPEYQVEVKMNSHGWRDVEHEYEKSPGVYRIVVLGDSFMEAYQVDLEDSLPRQLEKMAHQAGYDQVEVINLGVSGYGTYQEYLVFVEEGLKYDPDLVLLAFFADNDVQNNSYVISQAFWGDSDPNFYSRPYLIKDDGDWQEIGPDYERAAAAANRNPIWEKTALYGVFQAYVLRRPSGELPKMGGYQGVYLCQPTVEYEEAWEATDESFALLDAAITEAGARLVVFTVPARAEVDPVYMQAALEQEDNPETLCIEDDAANQRTEQMLADRDILLVNLLEPFRDSDVTLFYKLDRHWNAEGHQLAAEIVLENLISWELLPPS